MREGVGRGGRDRKGGDQLHTLALKSNPFVFTERRLSAAMLVIC